jgi:hypothetical protein
MNIRRTVLPATIAAIAITAAIVGGSFAVGANREPPATRQVIERCRVTRALDEKAGRQCTVDVYINGVFSRGPIRGTVAASQAKAVISLHGLQPKTSYQVEASSKPCSVADATGSVAWQLDVQTGSGDDVFQIGAIDNTIADGPQRIRSIRAIDNTVADGPVRVCTKATTLRRIGGA